jgi:uncharacterized protein YerC
MEVPKRLMRKWKLQKEYGDQKKISDESGISEVTISNVLRTGRGDKKTIVAINNFYKEKPKQKKNKEKQLIAEID